MPEATPPAPELEAPPAESARGISLVWLVPLLALVVALARRLAHLLRPRAR